MIVLGLDTSTMLTCAAAGVWPDGGVPYGVRRLEHRPAASERPAHARRLLEFAIDVLGGRPVERIAVGIGPGSFTGLRIGIATAQGLALGFGVPLVGVSTLQALGRGAGAWIPAGRPWLAVIDARRGELFLAGWSGGDAARPPLHPAPCVVGPERLPALIAPGTIAFGDGALAYQSVLEAAGAEVPADGQLHRVDGTEICRLGAEAAAPPVSSTVQPLYLREPDAKPRPGR